MTWWQCYSWLATAYVFVTISFCPAFRITRGDGRPASDMEDAIASLVVAVCLGWILWPAVAVVFVKWYLRQGKEVVNRD